MKKTVDDFLKARPCPPYNREKIWELVGDDGVTPEELAKLNIPWRDILWGLIYVWMTPQQCLEFTAICADKAKSRVVVFPDCRESREAAYKTERAMLQAGRATRMPRGAKSLARRSAWNAAEATMNIVWLYWRITPIEDLLGTAFSIIG